jgi:hypothetical protein
MVPNIQAALCGVPSEVDGIVTQSTRLKLLHELIGCHAKLLLEHLAGALKVRTPRFRQLGFSA